MMICECVENCGLQIDADVWKKAKKELNKRGFPRAEYCIRHPKCPSLKTLKWVLVPDYYYEDEED